MSLIHPTPLHAAIIDLDGTLIDTLGDFQVALNAMLDNLSLPQLQRAQVEPLVGKGSENLVRGALALQAPRAALALFAPALQSYMHHYERINGAHAQVYPGVIEGLQRLQARGLRLACLTNKPVAFARPLLQAKGLDGYFELVFGGDSFARKKPDPLPLIKTCEALGLPPAQVLMVGDSSNDAQAARGAGCPVVLVSYGYNHGEPVRQVDADGHIDSLAELFAADAPA